MPDYQEIIVEKIEPTGMPIRKIIIPYLAILFLTLSIFCVSALAGTIQGKVTSIEGKNIQLDVGSNKGIAVGNKGKVYDKAVVKNGDKRVSIAEFSVKFISPDACMAEIGQKTGEIAVGYTAEVETGASKKTEDKTKAATQGAKSKAEPKTVVSKVETTSGQTGMIIMSSVPFGAETEMFIDGTSKGKGDMIKDVAVGEHKIMFKKDASELSGAFIVKAGETLDLLADFSKNKIINSADQKVIAEGTKKNGDKETGVSSSGNQAQQGTPAKTVQTATTLSDPDRKETIDWILEKLRKYIFIKEGWQGEKYAENLITDSKMEIQFDEVNGELIINSSYHFELWSTDLADKRYFSAEGTEKNIHTIPISRITDVRVEKDLLIFNSDINAIIANLSSNYIDQTTQKDMKASSRDFLDSFRFDFHNVENNIGARLKKAIEHLKLYYPSNSAKEKF